MPYSASSDAFQNLLQLLSCLKPLDFFLTNSPSGMYSTAVSSSLLRSLESSESSALFLRGVSSLSKIISSLRFPVKSLVFDASSSDLFGIFSFSIEYFPFFKNSSSFSSTISFSLLMLLFSFSATSELPSFLF